MSSCPPLAHRALFGVAVSNFNRREMLAAGFRRVDVLPVKVDFSEFTVVGGQMTIESLPMSGSTLVVLIGNKCQHEFVAAFAIYQSVFPQRETAARPDRRHVGHRLRVGGAGVGGSGPPQGPRIG